MASIAECLAMTRFIPPAGAMQFEVTLMRRPETKPLEGTAVWLVQNDKGDLARNHFCDCKKDWELLLDSVQVGSVREFLDTIVNELRKKGSPRISVCACNGRFIE